MRGSGRLGIALVVAGAALLPTTATADAATVAPATADAAAVAPTTVLAVPPPTGTALSPAPHPGTAGRAPAPHPGTTGSAPAPAGCPGEQAPPPPIPKEELAGAAPAALPWPDAPVGGPGLGACGDVLPPGFVVPAGITAAGWLVADLDTGAVLAAHAPHARHRPASTMKVLTALVALDRLNPDTVVDATAEDANIEGSRAGIGPDGHYTVRQLLEGLLLNSGNDTANALARALGGPAAATAAMNATARRYGALDTRAATPSGLDGPGMSVSAYDLAVLYRVALRNPLFAQISAMRSVPFPGHGALPPFTMSNTEKLPYHYPGTLAGKTGFTDAARHTFVGAAEHNGRRLMVALVRGEQRPVPMWKQEAELLDAGFALPRDAPAVGVLVDSGPPEPVQPRPAAPVPAPGHVTSASAAVVPIALGAAACAGIGGLLLVRRVRRRRSAPSGGAGELPS